MTPSWGFLTNHALVLIYVVRHAGATVREIASGVGVTERATLTILRQLSDDGVIERAREGRRTTYSVNFERMAAYRREGTVSLTPREFVDGLIQTLLATSHAASSVPSAPAQIVDSRALSPTLGTWGFFTNHALLLLSIAMDNRSTVREMAADASLTERAIVAILNQLAEEGVIVREREGRRNSYHIDFAALRAFPRWSPGDWRLPAQLIDVAVEGLFALAARSGTGGIEAEPRIARA